MKIFLKRKTKALAVLLALCAALALPAGTPAYAAETLVYAALGDSVPSGYALASPETEGYVNLFAEYLKAGGLAVETHNMAEPGLTTAGMLEWLGSLSGPERGVFAGAGLITLNIGGNNILGPFAAQIGELAAEFGISDISRATPAQLGQAALALASFSPDADLSAALAAGVRAFEADFPEIIARVYELAPHAELIVSTVYNPIPAGMGVSALAEELIGEINAVIFDEQAAFEYSVADVRAAFEQLGSAGIALTNVNFDAANGSFGFDIHPNAAGHALIALIHQASFTVYLPLTRGMAVTALYRMANSPKDAAAFPNPFSDVPEGAYYAGAVKWAAKNGLVSGYGGGLFGPDDLITRQDLALIVWRFQEFTGRIAPDILMDLEYADWNDISAYAKSAVTRLTAQGMFGAGKDKNFGPGLWASRYEFSAMIRMIFTADTPRAAS